MVAEGSDETFGAHHASVGAIERRRPRLTVERPNRIVEALGDRATVELESIEGETCAASRPTVAVKDGSGTRGSESGRRSRSSTRVSGEGLVQVRYLAGLGDDVRGLFRRDVLRSLV